MTPNELRDLQYALLQGAPLTPKQQAQLQAWPGAAEYQAVIAAVARTQVPQREPSETMDARILAAARRRPAGRQGWLAAWLGESWSGWHWATTGLAGALGVVMVLAMVRAWLPATDSGALPDHGQEVVVGLTPAESFQPLAPGQAELNQAPLQVLHPLLSREAAAVAFGGSDVDQQVSALQVEIALDLEGEKQVQSYLEVTQGI